MTQIDDRESQIFEYELEASPAKIWRAVTIPEYRDRWLPGRTLVDGKPLHVEEGRSVRYRVQEESSPFVESEVTFELMPGTNGNTIFRITHTLEMQKAMPAANSNDPQVLRMAA